MLVIQPCVYGFVWKEPLVELHHNRCVRGVVKDILIDLHRRMSLRCALDSLGLVGGPTRLRRVDIIERCSESETRFTPYPDHQHPPHHVGNLRHYLLLNITSDCINWMVKMLPRKIYSLPLPASTIFALKSAGFETLNDFEGLDADQLSEGEPEYQYQFGIWKFDRSNAYQT